MNDDKLRTAYNMHVEGNAPSNRSGCPSPEQLQRLAESGQGGDSNNLKLLNHVFSCAYCRADFALLRAVETSVQSSAESEQAQRQATQKRNGWFSSPRIAIAASLLLAIGIGGEFWLRAQARASALRGAPIDTSDVVIVAPSANTAISPDAPFVWRKVAGAATYEVQLLDTNGVVIATHITSDTVFTPATEDRARIAALTKLDWFVSARRSDGNERRSAIARVSVNVRGP